MRLYSNNNVYGYHKASAYSFIKCKYIIEYILSLFRPETNHFKHNCLDTRSPESVKNYFYICLSSFMSKKHPTLSQPLYKHGFHPQRSQRVKINNSWSEITTCKVTTKLNKLKEQINNIGLALSLVGYLLRGNISVIILFICTLKCHAFSNHQLLFTKINNM